MKYQLPELTAMSGIAIVFVLFIHACGSCQGYFYPGKDYAETDIFLRTFINLITPAVPMFLFASGFKYALHDLDTPYFSFLKKRLPRVLMSFFIINTLFWVIDSIIWMDQFDPVLLLKTYISSWLGNTVVYPYVLLRDYFMPANLSGPSEKLDAFSSVSGRWLCPTSSGGLYSPVGPIPISIRVVPSVF